MKIIPELMSERILTERTIHVISTPCRVCFTRALQKFAVNMYYEPYVLGKYKQKNVLMFKNNFNVVEIYNIYKILRLIKTFNIYNRALIIMGNYWHTGESITFVHRDYGTIFINHRLISNTPTEDHQQAARLNYKKDGFPKDYQFKPKYLV